MLRGAVGGWQRRTPASAEGGVEKLSGLAVFCFFFQHSGSSASIFVVSSRTFGRKHLAVIKKHPPAQFRCVPEQIVRSSVVVVQDGRATSSAELQRYMDSAAGNKKPSSQAASRCFWTGGGMKAGGGCTAPSWSSVSPSASAPSPLETAACCRCELASFIPHTRLQNR